MNIEKPLHFIQQVSEITGLSKLVIRKWEERYQIVIPERLENGYRVYTEADVNKILSVKGLTEQGYSVKQAVLLIDKIEPKPEPTPVIPAGQTKSQPQATNDYVIELIKEGTGCHEAGMNYIFQQAYHEKGLEYFIHSVAFPFLLEMGNRWETGEWEEYQEAIASMTLRDFLIELRRNFIVRKEAPTLLGACLPHEKHEIPVMLILLQAMVKGWKTVLIGATPAQGSIENTVQKLLPDRVVLSATTTTPFEQDPDALFKLDQFAGTCEKTDFYLGGPGAIEYMSKSKRKLEFIHLSQSLNHMLEIK
ncbi:DNA-binding transcriptional MerR regulator [Bacillus mesophilus]|uniref:MerR family transcriptional regulator n=1 Tax=Bacillus mesophilus TaxID=1808955 RepID=A0A6M0QAK2_9BACI|nr:MerR family transcriptional regulator [Bacillus mesophilus]MBM7662831.1 DNA-binding transcriptional MerR regulator [Bacillus mesophilus]NEY73421.1 MerR family transcriptional regulator [Bacillus mesophilus]